MRNPLNRIPTGPGWAQGIANHLKLVWRLMRDRRIHPLVKLIPFSSLLYFVSPFDLPLPIDDVGVIWFATVLFIEFSPPAIVEEHRLAIHNTVNVEWKELEGPPDEPPQV